MKKKREVKIVQKEERNTEATYQLEFFYFRSSFRNMNQFYKDEFTKFFSVFTKLKDGSYEKNFIQTSKKVMDNVIANFIKV